MKGKKGSMRRREALKIIGCGTCAVATFGSGCTFSELYSDFEGRAVDVDLTTPVFQPLQEVGNMVALDVGPIKLNLIRSSMEEIVALDRICPHLQEDMAPIGSSNEAKGLFTDGTLICTAHGSQFDLSGAAIGGPTNVTLQRFPVRFDSELGLATVYVGVEVPINEVDQGAENS